MICEVCRRRQASIHYFESVNGRHRTVNMCEICAFASDPMAPPEIPEAMKGGSSLEGWKPEIPEGIDMSKDETHMVWSVKKPGGIFEVFHRRKLGDD